MGAHLGAWEVWVGFWVNLWSFMEIWIGGSVWVGKLRKLNFEVGVGGFWTGVALALE